MKKVSLKDIAEELGVSKALVSLVLNGKGDERGINKNTQEKVRKKAVELNYRPNQYARGLRMGKTKTIGIIVPDISNVFYGTLCKAIEKKAYEIGYNLIISNSYEDNEKEIKLVGELMNRNIDGLILASSFEKDTDFEVLNFREFPVVLVDRKFDNLAIDSVSVTNEQGAKEITSYLLKEGVQKAACFAISPTHISSIEERVEGFNLANGNRPYQTVYDISHENIYADVKKVLKDIEGQGFDGIFCSNNSIAKALIKLGMKGEDFFEQYTVVSFDDIELFDLVAPRITTVAQPLDEIGANALKILLEKIENPGSKEVIKMVLPTRLITR
jgi:LacI family transcriptional regulator